MLPLPTDKNAIIALNLGEKSTKKRGKEASSRVGKA